MSLLDKNELGIFIIPMVILFGFFVIYTTSFAQQSQTESFSFTVAPQNPEPFSQVSVSISSFSVDLDRALIKWNINGELTLSGIGEKSTQVRVGDSGDVTIIKVEALFANGNKLNKNLVLQPASMDILWEATDSYTPPFYKGKALPSPEAKIKVIANPELKSLGGNRYDTKSLIYTWKKGGDTQQSVSGFGKQSFSFQHNFFDKEQDIRVTVESPNGISTAEKSIVIPFSRPLVGVYKEDIQKGINFSKEISKSSDYFSGKVSLVAVPYFFSVKTANDKDLSYVWKINGKSSQQQEIKNKLTVSKGGEDAGSAGIEVKIESVLKLFQEGFNSFNLNLQ